MEFATPEQLFYITKNKKYLAYWPKKLCSLIGSYTEKWATDLFSETAKMVGGYAVQGVIAEEIGLTNQSPEDVAICKTKDIIQSLENILMIIEVKMSVVWNWEFFPATKNLVCIGDYRTHQGNPGLLRSDTISYYEKVDHLKRNGIIQGFWSINPKPLDNDGENIKSTPFKGFYNEELRQSTINLLKEER